MSSVATSLTVTAENLVALRFAARNDYVAQVQEELNSLISALVTIAYQVAGINVNTTIPLDMPDMPTAPPFSDRLVDGANGISSGTGTAIWARCVVRAASILSEGLSDLSGQFSNWSAPAQEQYDALVQWELDKNADHLLDITRVQGIKEYEITSAFCKLITQKYAEWSLIKHESDQRIASAKAELMLSQAEAAIKEVLAKSDLQMNSYIAAGDAAAHEAGAAAQAASASVSVSTSASDEESSTTSSETSIESSVSTTQVQSATESTNYTVISGE